MTTTIPESYYILDPDDPFEMETGPFHVRNDDAGRSYAFRMEPRHANAGGAIHGGALMTFADFAICAEAVRGYADEAPVTISFTSEFIAPVETGSLIESRPQILRRTGGLVFMRATLTVDDAPVLSCTGVVKRLKLRR